jgi:hypothetical protein
MRRKWYLIAPAAIAGIIVFSFLGGEVVKLLWNWLLPPLFGFRQVTFWQAFGLLALSRILFGGWGRGGGRGWGRDRARRRMLERWSRMTPEERERFREDMRRCGGWAGATASPYDPPETPMPG